MAWFSRYWILKILDFTSNFESGLFIYLFRVLDCLWRAKTHVVIFIPLYITLGHCMTKVFKEICPHILFCFWIRARRQICPHVVCFWNRARRRKYYILHTDNPRTFEGTHSSIYKGYWRNFVSQLVSQPVSQLVRQSVTRFSRKRKIFKKNRLNPEPLVVIYFQGDTHDFLKILQVHWTC